VIIRSANLMSLSSKSNCRGGDGGMCLYKAQKK
jgi:hypothetical protein